MEEKRYILSIKRHGSQQEPTMFHSDEIIELIKCADAHGIMEPGSEKYGYTIYGYQGASIFQKVGIKNRIKWNDYGKSFFAQRIYHNYLKGEKSFGGVTIPKPEPVESVKTEEIIFRLPRFSSNFELVYEGD